MLEEIRKRLQDVPFRKFYVRLSDGRKIMVPHPDFVWMPAPGVLHIWIDKEKASEHINPSLIVSVESRAQVA